MLIISLIFTCLVVISIAVAAESRNAGASVFLAIVFLLFSLMFMHIAGIESVIGVEKGEIYDFSCDIGTRVVVANKSGKSIKITSRERISHLADGRLIILGMGDAIRQTEVKK